MNIILKLEEIAQFVLAIVGFSMLEYAWWWFPALLLTPDVGMLGYIINPEVGAFTYNLLHHKGVAIALVIFGYFYMYPVCILIGVILFAHAAFDRVLGYGLKYSDSFQHTHLGQIGKK